MTCVTRYLRKHGLPSRPNFLTPIFLIGQPPGPAPCRVQPALRTQLGCLAQHEADLAARRVSPRVSSTRMGDSHAMAGNSRRRSVSAPAAKRGGRNHSSALGPARMHPAKRPRGLPRALRNGVKTLLACPWLVTPPGTVLDFGGSAPPCLPSTSSLPSSVAVHLVTGSSYGHRHWARLLHSAKQTDPTRRAISSNANEGTPN